MGLDPVILSRLQFGVGDRLAHPAAGFHRRDRLLYRPTRRAAISSRGSEIYLRISLFWTQDLRRRFRHGRRVGHRHAVPVRHQLEPLSDATANVVSPMLAYEGLMAFFLEAAFLGVLLFGRSLVPRWAHFIAAVMVAFGTLLSSFWILAANSWMQTPAGLQLVDGRFYPDRLVGHRLQSVLSLSLCPHCGRLLCHHRLRRARRRRRLIAARHVRAEGARHADHDPWLAGRAGAVADFSGRPAWPQHPAIPARQARRDRGALDTRDARCRSLCSPFPIRKRKPITPMLEVPLSGQFDPDP